MHGGDLELEYGRRTANMVIRSPCLGWLLRQGGTRWMQCMSWDSESINLSSLWMTLLQLIFPQPPRAFLWHRSRSGSCKMFGGGWKTLDRPPQLQMRRHSERRLPIWSRWTYLRSGFYGGDWMWPQQSVSSLLRLQSISSTLMSWWEVRWWDWGGPERIRTHYTILGPFSPGWFLQEDATLQGLGCFPPSDFQEA